MSDKTFNSSYEAENVEAGIVEAENIEAENTEDMSNCCCQKKVRNEKEIKDLMNRLNRIDGQIVGRIVPVIAVGFEDRIQI